MSAEIDRKHAAHPRGGEPALVPCVLAGDDPARLARLGEQLAGAGCMCVITIPGAAPAQFARGWHGAVLVLDRACGGAVGMAADELVVDGVPVPLVVIGAPGGDAIRAELAAFDVAEFVSEPAEPEALAVRVRLLARTRGYAAEAAAARREVDHLRRTNEHLDAFAAVASHDLQEPLRQVTSYVQLLRKRYAAALDQRANDYLALVSDGVERMRALIYASLEFARSANRAPRLDLFDASDAVAEAVDNLAPRIQSVDAEICASELPMVVADRLQLMRVFQNLISNGIKFVRDRRPRIAITARDDGERWVFSVADNGIGVPATRRDELFKPFRRLHTRDDFPGTGIGLAICRAVVDAHRGQIWVESVADGGSVFSFSIPKHHA